MKSGREGKGDLGRNIDSRRIGIDMHLVDDPFRGSRINCMELFSRVITMTREYDFLVVADAPQKTLSFSVVFSLSNVTAFRMPKKSAMERLLHQLLKIVDKERVRLLHTQYIVSPRVSCLTAVTVHEVCLNRVDNTLRDCL